MKRLASLGVCCLALLGSGLAQTSSQPPGQSKPPQAGQQPPSQGQTTGTQKSPAGAAQAQQEYTALQQINSTQDPKAKIPLIEDFLSKYPNSQYIPFVYQQGSFAYMQQNNFEKMSDYGEKALAGLPDDASKALLLTQLANAYAEKQMGDKAEEKAKKALGLLETLAKPAQISDEQWNQAKTSLLASNYSTLGFVHLQKGQAAHQASRTKLEPIDKKIEAVEKERDNLKNAKNFDAKALAAKQDELEKLNAERDTLKKDVGKGGSTELNAAVEQFKKALSINNKDDYTYYRLGFAYMLLNDADASINSFAKAVALQGVAAQPSRKFLEEVYKAKNKSLGGLEDVIKKAGEEVQSK